VRLVLNGLMLLLLVRLWPLGGGGGGRLGWGGGEAEPVLVTVPFSEFLRRVKHDDVYSMSVGALMLFRV
jgi:hypothetical protein